MRKLIKKALMMAMAFFVVLTSANLTYAVEPTGTITINSGKHDVTNVTFNVYQMFSATKSDKNVAYRMNADFEEFFNTNATNTEGETAEEKAYNYVKENVANKDFQDKVKAYITTKSINPKTSVTGVKDQKVYTTESLGYGYYVIIPSGTEFTPSFTTLQDTNQNVYLKGKTPDVVKKVNDKDWESAKIGEPITFTVTSFVPNMTGYTEYHFKLTDTMTDGLTVTTDTLEPTVKIGDQTLTKDTHYEVTVLDQNITITIKDFINYKDKANEPIVFTYKAVLNDTAVTNKPETNEANVHWGNNPDHLTSGTPDVVRVVTHKLTITKVNESGETLAGAIFELYQGTTTEENNKLSFVKLTEEGKYRVATAADQTPVTELITPSTGIIEIEGLKDGEYRLVETKAPDGYNILKDPTVINIVASSDNEGVNVTVDGNLVTVTNKAGILLPETGGMGTVLFSVVGTVGILAVAYSFMVSNKKKKSN